MVKKAKLTAAILGRAKPMISKVVVPRPRPGAGSRVGAGVEMWTTLIADLTTSSTGQNCMRKLCQIVLDLPKSCELNVANITLC